jgi:hypothetical protein
MALRYFFNVSNCDCGCISPKWGEGIVQHGTHRVHLIGFPSFAGLDIWQQTIFSCLVCSGWSGIRTFSLLTLTVVLSWIQRRPSRSVRLSLFILSITLDIYFIPYCHMRPWPCQESRRGKKDCIPINQSTEQIRFYKKL